MAHSISAKKRDRQNVRRKVRNRARESVLKTKTRKLTEALAGTDKAKSASAMTELASAVDKAAARGTIHPNTAARRKSRLMRRLNASAK